MNHILPKTSKLQCVIQKTGRNFKRWTLVSRLFLISGDDGESLHDRLLLYRA